ncbi:MAG: hypothetical protein KC503_45280 [Myxococcales bacterium]|nr:hypothetical protein [Myxococcales bacterium]
MRPLLSLLLAVLLASACSESTSSREGSRARTGTTGPGSALVTFEYPAQKSRTDPGGWGAVLTDIDNHLPSKYGSTYYDSDRVTHGHETTHGINSELRNSHNTTGAKANGFYLLENRGVVIAEPNMSKARVAALVPSGLRGSRFSLYVSGQTAWNDRPLYLFDEWVAYINGAAVGVDLMKAGKWTYGNRDAVAGALEFVSYGVATAMAIEQNDPSYFTSNDQFRELLAFLLRRAMKLFYAGKDYAPFQFQSQAKLFAELTGSGGKSIRDWVEKTFGKAFSDEVFFNVTAPQSDDAGPGADTTLPAPDSGAADSAPSSDATQDSATPDAGAGGDATPDTHDSGTDGADNEPPKVTILTPSANERVAQQITVRAQISDNVAILDAELYLGELLATSRGAPPWDFVVNLPPGPALLRVIARDTSGNRGVADVRVEVEGEVVPTPPHPEEPDAGPGLDGSPDAGAPPPPPSPPQAPPAASPDQQTTTGSLSCSAAPGSGAPPASSLLLLALLALRRRRRSRYLRRR